MLRTEGWPDAVSLDPGEAASPVFEQVLRSLSSTPVVLLAVGPKAQQGGWAAEVTIALADQLAATGERVVVADLSLDKPELHDKVGTDNTEGLTDVFLFGASLEHVTRMLPVHSFELVPAAAYTPDTEEILTHRRWSMVFEELAATKTRLLLYLPVSVQGAGAFSDRVGHTVVLADRWEADTVKSALSPDADVLAFLEPPHSEPPVPPANEAAPKTRTESGPRRAPDDEFEKIRVPKDSAREALIADLRARQRAALMAPPPKIEPLPPDEVDVAPAKPVTTSPSRPPLSFPPAAPGISEPTFITTQRQKKKKRRLLPVGLVLLVASSLAATWHYWGRDAWRTWRSSPEGANVMQPGAPADAQTEPAPPPEPVLPEGRPLPYSVAIAVYPLLDHAQEHVQRLNAQAGEYQYFIAPTVVQGSLLYRVLCGPLPDSATAAAVRDSLFNRGVKTVKLPSDVLRAPLAFLIGSFDTRAQAEARQAEALSKGMPTYIVPIAANGKNQYRLYAGTHTGPGDAEFMRTLLRAAQLPVTLVERTGSISS